MWQKKIIECKPRVISYTLDRSSAHGLPSEIEDATFVTRERQGSKITFHSLPSLGLRGGILDSDVQPHSVRLGIQLRIETVSYNINIHFYDDHEIAGLREEVRGHYRPILDSNLERWMDIQTEAEREAEACKELYQHHCRECVDGRTAEKVATILTDHRIYPLDLLFLLDRARSIEEGESNIVQCKNDLLAKVAEYEQKGYVIVENCQRGYRGSSKSQEVHANAPLSDTERRIVLPLALFTIKTLPELEEPFREKTYYQEKLARLCQVLDRTSAS
ncbi:hypothetical protein HYW21_00680 [Candidatus Woesearchaeota archaeon]|nr:hypothetical protein [Candidatus Woesearchaeota archaeon]